MLSTKCDKTFYFFVVFFLIHLQHVQSDEIDDKKYGILAAESSSARKNFCIIYFPIFSDLPVEKPKDFHPLEDCTDVDFCNELSLPELSLKSPIILLLQRSNCSLATQARTVQDVGGTAALFVMPSGKVDDMKVNNSEAEGINITVALISSNSVLDLHKMKGDACITACMFAPARFGFDFSFLIIWVIAMFTICVGGYWSGIVRLTLYSDEIHDQEALQEENIQDEHSELPADRPAKITRESSLNISPAAVAVLVILMITTLLLLYFFFDYLVYFLIAVFFIVSIQSVYAGLYPFVMKVFPPCFKCFGCHRRDKMCSFDYRHIILFTVAAVLAVFWIVTRKEKYSWVLQDILGIFFCINMIKTIRLPSFKICTMLLVLLFFYDIFFVFVTPFLTAKGESVMEKVAAGRQSDEIFPMVLRVPHLSFDSLAICYQRYLLLGFGDILVPGLLVAYCHGYDLIFNKSRTYFYLSSCSYGLGLVLTFVSLFLMSSAQPALLYLVPITLLPPIVLSLKRGEFKQFWTGFKKCQISDSTNIPASNAATTDISNVELPSVSNTEVSSSANNTSESEVKNLPKKLPDSSDEKKHLL